MKKILFLFAIILVALPMLSQNIFEPSVNFSDDELEIIAKAKKDIDRGDNMMNIANTDYQKYKNLFTSRKKRKKAKAEGKTVQAKRNMLTAATFYNKGYEALYEIYMDKLSTLNFQFTEDKNTADDLVAKAQDEFSSGQKTLPLKVNYSDKDLKKKIKFNTIKSKVNKGQQAEEQAVIYLLNAFDLYSQQEVKKQQITEEDNNAWQKALRENSIDAYQQYIDKYPSGIHVTEANTKIAELERQVEIAQQQQTNPELVYHIQIMADTHPWTVNEIKNKIYYTNETINEQYINGWYKYWIEDFSSYSEAKAKLSQIRKKRRGAFIVGTVNGVLVDITKAIEVENQQTN